MDAKCVVKRHCMVGGQRWWSGEEGGGTGEWMRCIGWVSVWLGLPYRHSGSDMVAISEAVPSNPLAARRGTVGKREVKVKVDKPEKVRVSHVERIYQPGGQTQVLL